MLKIVEISNKQEYSEFMDKLNKETSILYEQMYSKFICMAENISQKQIFNDWWHGKCVSTNEYKERYSEHDNYQASSLILHAVSMGFG